MRVYLECNLFEVEGRKGANTYSRTLIQMPGYARVVNQGLGGMKSNRFELCFRLAGGKGCVRICLNSKTALCSYMICDTNSFFSFVCITGEVASTSNAI